MSQQLLRVRSDGAIMHVSINNPPVNLVNGAMVQALFELVGGLTFDTSVKVVIFESGVADFFIAHFDLNDLLAAGDDTASKSKSDDINILQSVSLCIQNLPQVTIAKVDGICRGAGLELILGMSMRFASDASRFCAPEASSGFLACGGGTTRLAMACGPARALEVLLSARDFSGKEAQEYGIINRVLPADELDSYVATLAERIAQRSAHAIGVNRETIKRTLAFAVEPLFAGLAYENEAMRSSMARPEFHEGVQAMLALGQGRETELDLPRTIDRLLAAVSKK
ncbi:enoyl-CoA hydratase/isomerase family protein [Janthinobacterium sp. HLX7-2]|uniref:enoyl-CoA hydratase/isomerase family protein n=1 Tax=Janthinobacterium sp. HLX7-2 TaxID=1259331 RepID=UPI003F1F129C